MAQTMSFLRLDLISIKPYLTWKNLLLITAVSFIMSVSTGDISASIAMFAMYGSIYLSYPFTVGEKNGIDTLYATLPLQRRHVVLGRYLYAVCMNALACVLAYVVSLCLFTLLRRDFSPGYALGVLAALFFVFSFVHTIQLPIFFKLGYDKAKFLAYFPFFTIPVIIYFANTVLKDSSVGKVLGTKVVAGIAWFTAHPLPTVALCAAVWALLFTASYQVSKRFYEKRDL